MSEIKNPGKSIRAKLLNVAKQKDVFYQTILTRYFTERLGDAFAIIADMRAKKINIQCRTCSKAFVCIHQCSTFQVEVLTVMSL